MTLASETGGLFCPSYVWPECHTRSGGMVVPGMTWQSDSAGLPCFPAATWASLFRLKCCKLGPAAAMTLQCWVGPINLNKLFGKQFVNALRILKLFIPSDPVSSFKGSSPGQVT